MLALSRKKGESVIITDSKTGDVIKVQVVHWNKGSVRLGFETPENMIIKREEIMNKES